MHITKKPEYINHHTETSKAQLPWHRGHPFVFYIAIRWQPETPLHSSESASPIVRSPAPPSKQLLENPTHCVVRNRNVVLKYFLRASTGQVSDDEYAILDTVSQAQRIHFAPRNMNSKMIFIEGYILETYSGYLVKTEETSEHQWTHDPQTSVNQWVPRRQMMNNNPILSMALCDFHTQKSLWEGF